MALSERCLTDLRGRAGEGVPGRGPGMAAGVRPTSRDRHREAAERALSSHPVTTFYYVINWERKFTHRITRLLTTQRNPSPTAAEQDRRIISRPSTPQIKRTRAFCPSHSSYGSRAQEAKCSPQSHERGSLGRRKARKTDLLQRHPGIPYPNLKPPSKQELPCDSLGGQGTFICFGRNERPH